MTVRTVWLPGPVALTPSGKAAEAAAREQYRSGAPTGAGGLGAVVAEIDRLVRTGMLPARIEADSRRLVVYTQRHAVSLYLTKYEDAYRLGHLAPLGFRDQERLLRGALLLHCPAGWYAYSQLTDLPRTTQWSGYWDAIRQAWTQLSAAPSATGPPAHHIAYLDLLTEVVEATRDIEIERQRSERPVPYRRRGSTAEERHSARGVYEFELLRPAPLAVGAPVYVTDEPELRGRVTAVRDRTVVVRFDQAVDYRQIPPQGALQVLPSDRVYRAQLDAIDALRQRQVANPELIGLLVDRVLQQYQPDLRAAPTSTLDPGQLDAFQRALTVPDQLLVLGPPGTGKTRTITEIAAACVARGQRVLITSYTNRAVDNVLERLPAQVRSIRVGNEDAMTSGARGYLIEAQVEALQEEILAATEGAAERLAPFAGPDPLPARWLDFQAARLAAAATADEDVRRHEVALDAAIRRVNAPLMARLAVADTELTQAQAYAQGVERSLQQARQRLTAAESRARTGPFAWYFRWLAGRRHRRHETHEAAWSRAQGRLVEAAAARKALRTKAEAAAVGDPEAGRAVAARDAAVTARQTAVDEARHAATMLRSILRPVAAVPGEPPNDLDGLRQYAATLDRAAALTRARAGLLDEWRTRVRAPGEDLHREMIRYADVVAATCIGTATTPLLAELEFDLAIVDEAGQISTPNLLVPLVRARRSVLVGDHHQLPPYLDDEVKGWSDSLIGSRDVPPAKAREIGDLLRRSAFERLYLAADPEHQVMLTVQRRMPESLAQFVSQVFYDSVLTTDHPGDPADPIFSRPFAMVDTSDRPAKARAERSGGRREEWGRHGYVNELEAALIVQLITEYRRWYPDWAVIVPYRAQAERIAESLVKVLGDGTGVADSVGTVDSFQGGERDLVVYGFTRSNPRGDIGFLKELRRINVAITRARRQLVLVGDTATLRSARDEGFSALVRSMTDYLGHSGDLRPSRQVQDGLVRLAKEFS